MHTLKPISTVMDQPDSKQHLGNPELNVDICKVKTWAVELIIAETGNADMVVCKLLSLLSNMMKFSE